MYVSIVDYGTGNLNSVFKALEVAATQINKKINIKISKKVGPNKKTVFTFT